MRKQTKAIADSRYSSLAGDGVDSSSRLDDEPVKLSAPSPKKNSSQEPSTSGNPYMSYDQQAMEEIEGLLLDDL